MIKRAGIRRLRWRGGYRATHRAPVHGTSARTPNLRMSGHITISLLLAIEIHSLAVDPAVGRIDLSRGRLDPHSPRGVGDVVRHVGLQPVAVVLPRRAGRAFTLKITARTLIRGVHVRAIRAECGVGRRIVPVAGPLRVLRAGAEVFPTPGAVDSLGVGVDPE